MQGKSEKDLAREIFDKMLESNAISLNDMLEFQQKKSAAKSDVAEENEEKVLKKIRPNFSEKEIDIDLDDMMQCERPKVANVEDNQGYSEAQIERMKKMMQQDSSSHNMALSTLVGFLPDDDHPISESKKRKKKGENLAEISQWRKEQY